MANNQSALTYSFASIEEGKIILSKEDDFLNSLSSLEMSIRMKTNSQVSKKEFISYLLNNVLAWDKSDMEKVQFATEEINKMLLKLNMHINQEIIFIKTTGYEEEHCGYTRQNAIMLPVAKLNSYTKEKLIPFISHEIFHILSRKNPRMRKRMYSLVGFSTMDNIQLPINLQEIKITNPDAPLNDYYIKATISNNRVPLTPVLTFNTSKYNPNEPESYFKSIEEKFLEIENKNNTWTYKNLNNGLAIYNRKDIHMSPEIINKYDEDIIQPDEILAEYFTDLVTQRVNSSNDHILTEMKSILYFYYNRIM